MSLSPTDLPVDLEVLPRLTGCDEAMRDEFLDDFLDIADGAWEDLRIAQARADLHALMHAAHRIKSSSQYIGAHRLGELSQALETAGEARDVATCAQLLPEWQQEWQVVDRFIEDHLAARATD